MGEPVGLTSVFGHWGGGGGFLGLAPGLTARHGDGERRGQQRGPGHAGLGRLGHCPQGQLPRGTKNFTRRGKKANAERMLLPFPSPA